MLVEPPSLKAPVLGLATLDLPSFAGQDSQQLARIGDDLRPEQRRDQPFPEGVHVLGGHRERRRGALQDAADPGQERATAHALTPHVQRLFRRPTSSSRPTMVNANWVAPAELPSVVSRKGTRSRTMASAVVLPAKSAHHAHTPPRR